MARLFAFLAVLFLAATAVACSKEPSGPTSDVFGSAPWTGDESLTYQVKDHDGDILGRITLGIDVQDGSTVLTQRFANETNRDESSVTVDNATFKPQSARRQIVTPNDDDMIEVTYNEQGAVIRHGERQSGITVPEHSYDNDTSLFLWRTIPFAEGYEATYNTIITNRRTRQKVKLSVTGKENVRVPAGEFTAWRLEITTSNARQVAWYADTPQRPLVRYDNDNGLIFELERQGS